MKYKPVLLTVALTLSGFAVAQSAPAPSSDPGAATAQAPAAATFAIHAGYRLTARRQHDADCSRGNQFFR